MIIDLLAIIGVLALIVAIIDLSAVESTGFWILGALLSALIWGIAFLPRSLMSNTPEINLPPLKRYESPTAFFLVILVEIGVGCTFVWPWIRRALHGV